MIAHRTFADYDQYVYKQGGKARGRREFLLKHLPQNIEGFTRTFRAIAPELKPGKILCLGARTGAESIAANDAGFKGSVGIDLHPVGPTVLQGDWHDLPFPDRSFENVYSNSLDHCLYLDKLCAQVKRVLVAGGRFYVMATNRNIDVARWMAKGGNEALCWQASDDLRDAICEQGFVVTYQRREDGKWGHYVFGVRA